MSNHKKHGILKAKKQFANDLQSDPDFIQYKRRCLIDNYFSYGCVTSCDNTYTLNQGPSCETLIAYYFKTLKLNTK